jgi:AraC family transcriptional regulator
VQHEGPNLLLRSREIDTLLGGSDLVGRSSLEQGWSGVVVERRTAPIAPRDEALLDCHYVILWRNGPMIAERDYTKGRFRRLVKDPGTLSLGSAGRLPAVRPKAAYDVIAGVFDPQALTQITEESEQPTVGSIHEHCGVSDQSLATLLDLLAAEASQGGANGKLYGDSLAWAAMARFNRLARGAARQNSARPDVPLPRGRLKRVLEKIEAEYHLNLRLAELAHESGYSRAHFLRMFASAMGVTPYAYVREFRLSKACEKLQSGTDSVTDIALACGFSSHSHLTHVFRERYGITPSDYRRKL